MTAQIIRSLILLTIISSSVGGLYYIITEHTGSFINAFLLTTIIQIIFFLIYNNILRYIAKLNLEKENIKLAQLAEKNKIFVECQGCKNTNNVSIDLTEENSFDCVHCGANNKINIEYSTVLPTKIIYDK
ncbi:MAG TPA: hypothetical protein DEG69_13100 [Flavobacteriaceae bacterium]|nr:hypothetical protein [Flavobacteriaceae bacterium]